MASNGLRFLLPTLKPDPKPGDSLAKEAGGPETAPQMLGAVLLAPGAIRRHACCGHDPPDARGWTDLSEDKPARSCVAHGESPTRAAIG